jgi:hypothetical protein
MPEHADAKLPYKMANVAFSDAWGRDLVFHASSISRAEPLVLTIH